MGGQTVPSDDSSEYHYQPLKNQVSDSPWFTKASSTRWSKKVICIGSVTLAIIFIALAGFTHSRSNSRVVRPSFVPRFSQNPKLFSQNEAFGQGLTTQTVAAWDALMPPGRGFVLIEDPPSYNLEPGIPTEIGIERFSVSVFHQLHCLGMIRTSYYSLLAGIDHEIIHGGHEIDPESRHRIHSEHVGHCFDYIRQALMCNADTTVEPATVERNGVRKQVDGWGVVHEGCVDWESLWEWMTEHQAPVPANISGIL